MSKFANQILLIPDKTDSERELVAEVWISEGGEVVRLGRFWEPPSLDRSKIRLYGNDSFCLVLAQKLNLQLVSPPDDLLLKVGLAWASRNIQLLTLTIAVDGNFPVFVKPLIPKTFKAAAYDSRSALLQECKGLHGDTPVIVSEVVSVMAESRAFVLDGKVRAFSVYEGSEDAEGGKVFTSQFVEQNHLPRTCVIDSAFISGRGWAFLEANASWGAGLNGCDPAGAAACIACATISS